MGEKQHPEERSHSTGRCGCTVRGGHGRGSGWGARGDVVPPKEWRRQAEVNSIKADPAFRSAIFVIGF